MQNPVELGKMDNSPLKPPAQDDLNMGNRISKIVTKTGDTGQTGLGNGVRINKSHPRIKTIGEVDELNSAIGYLRSFPLESSTLTLLELIQNHCFELGAELCVPDTTQITIEHVAILEQALETLNQELPPLKEFILPGGTPEGAYCHLCRTVCRRAERTLVELAQNETISENSLIYLNRLSDLLFVLARSINRHSGSSEAMWQSQRLKQSEEPTS